VNWKDPLIALPQWHLTKSGILIPTQVGPNAIPEHDEPLPPGLPLSGGPDLLILAEPPSAFEQVHTFADEVRAGYPRNSTPEELIEMVSGLPLEPGMVALAQLSAHVAHFPLDTKAQLELAPTIFGDLRLVAHLKRFEREARGDLVIFPQQHMTALQRLLVLHGEDVALGAERPAAEQEVFNRAFFAAGALTDDRKPGPPGDPASREAWITHLLQNGTYNASDGPMESMTRHQALFGEIAARFKDHRDYCPINDWFIGDYGLSVAEQLALGFAVAASTKVWEESLGIRDRGVLGADFFTELADLLGRDRERVLELLTADRSWYAEEFRTGEQTTTRAAWERTPFEKRPLLRLADGRFLLLSPAAIHSWIGEGFFHRALACARRREESERLMRFYGTLVEAYALQTLQHAHPEPRPAGSGRVTGDRPYSERDPRRTPDISVDAGPDLVLIEVKSGRFATQTLIDGNPEKAAADLRRLLYGKLDQLGRRIDDLLAREWILPDVDLSNVERIWPVLVTADMLQNDALWGAINDRLPAGLRQARVQKLTLLDLPDLELLAALVEQGFGLADLLRRKASSLYAEMDLRRFVTDTPDIPRRVRLAAIVRRWGEAMDEAITLFGWDPSDRPRPEEDG
jgi:hypothetical protein